MYRSKTLHIYNNFNMARQVVKRMIDIGANLTDPMFQGIYNSKRKHESDYSSVIVRANENAVEKIIITGGNLSESQKAISLSQEHDNLYSTVGCHPTRCKEFEDHASGPEDYLKNLRDLINSSRSKVVAVGEIGLDYDRLHFCPKEIQQRYFELQLSLAENTGLPLFLHNRASSDDFFHILSRNRDKFHRGVVHSFDGTKEDVNKIIDLDLHIGINGCSLKTEANIEVVAGIPKELLMIETDCPWCGIKQSHASFKHVKTNPPSVKLKSIQSAPKLPVRERNEPSNLIQVLEVLSEIRQEDISELAEQIYQNTEQVFFSSP